MAEPLVLLHGFAGTRHSWDQVTARLDRARYLPLAIDLPGHGDRRDVEPSFDGAVQATLSAVDGPFALCGYSMGGRTALQTALAAPARISRLILVATMAGIEDATERERRREGDEKLARFCERATIEQFADRWQSQPIFTGTEAEAIAVWREDILRNDPGALASVLRATGAGEMEPLWGRLAELRMPCTVVAGERDAKYVALGRLLAEMLPDAELVVLQGAGHGLPREDPGALAAAIENAR